MERLKYIAILCVNSLILCVIVSAKVTLRQREVESPRLIPLTDGRLEHDFAETPSGRWRRSAPSPPGAASPSALATPSPDVSESQFSDKTHSEAVVHFSGSASNVTFVLTRAPFLNRTIKSSTLYRSTNYGYNFTVVDVTSGKSPKSEVVISSYIASKANKDMLLFVDNKNKRLYQTFDEGETYQFRPLTFIVDKLLKHPTNASWVLAYSQATRTLQMTDDFGNSWNMVDENVNPRFYWGETWENDDGSTGGDPSDMIHMEVLDPVSGQFCYKACKIPYSNCKNESLFAKELGTIDVESLLVEKEYIFVQKSTQFSTWLYVSYKRKPFQMAYFPRNRHPKDISVVNADEHQVFIAGYHSGHSVTLYLSDTTGQYYIVSKDKILPDDAGLYEVKSLPGVYVANQYEAQGFKSYITFDQGGKWDLINPPKLDSSKKSTGCSLDKGCSLHLHLGLSTTLAPFAASDHNAPGLIFAQGILGTTWNSSHTADTEMYMSSDGGVTWIATLKGFFHINILDHGGAIVAVPATFTSGDTNLIHFSIDEGRSWAPKKFHSDPMPVYGVLNEPGITSLVVIIFGREETKDGWQVIQVNFQKSLATPCKKTDYEDWTPQVEGHRCLLGKTLVYSRRKASSECFNGRGFTHVHNFTVCKCLWEDYECDYGYEFTKDNKQCTASAWFDPAVPVVACPLGTKYNKSSGYRKVASDYCHTPLPDAKPTVTACPIVAPNGLHLRVDSSASTVLESGKTAKFSLLQEQGSKTQTTYTWNFGDSTSMSIFKNFSEGQTLIHSYAGTGSFIVVVTVTNTKGNATVSLRVLVEERLSSVFAETPHGVMVGHKQEFVVDLLHAGSRSKHHHDVFTHYLWTFGDENDSDVHPSVAWERTISHTYNKPGNYSVQVMALNALGSNFHQFVLPVYGTLTTVQLKFESAMDMYNKHNIVWREMFARAVRDMLIEELELGAMKLEVVTLQKTPVTVDVSVLPDQQTLTADASIDVVVNNLLTRANGKSLKVHMMKRDFDEDVRVNITGGAVITDVPVPAPTTHNYVAVYVCIPILLAAIFVSALVVLYYKKTFSQRRRRYDLLQNQSDAGDSLLDDTDDDDPPLDPNPPESNNQRLALSDDDLDDPLGLLGSSRTVNA